MRVLCGLVVATLFAVSCGGSEATEPDTPEPVPTAAIAIEPAQPISELGPGGFGFDRSDPAGGVENIMAAFAVDEVTATCIFDAWGDVANVPAEQLTPELMTFEICGTSIFQMITGDSRFTGQGGS